MAAAMMARSSRLSSALRAQARALPWERPSSSSPSGAGARVARSIHRRFVSSDSSDHQSKVDEALKILKGLEKKLPAVTENEKITGLEIRIARLEAHVVWGGVLIGVFGTLAVVLPGALYTTQNALEDAKTKQDDMGKTINSLKDQVRLLELRNEMAAVLPTDAATSSKATEDVQLPTEGTPSTPPEPVKHVSSTPQAPWYRLLRFGL